MKTSPPKTNTLAILLFIFLVSLSCSNDADLLADTVLSDKVVNKGIVVNDYFVINSDKSIILDVLFNDDFSSEEDVRITEISTPKLGSAIINDDMTLTYSPPVATEAEEEQPPVVTDTFVYTAEVVNKNDEVTTEEGTVEVVIESIETLNDTSQSGVIDPPVIPPLLDIKGASIYTDDFEGGRAPWGVNGEYNAGGATNALSTIQTDAHALSGTHVLRMRSDDTTTGSISQTNNFRYKTFNANDDVVIEFSMKLPQIIDLENNFNTFNNIWQVKGVDNSPFRNDPLWTIGLECRGGRGTGGANYLTLNYLGQFWPEYGISQFKVTEIGTTNIEIDVWHKITIRYKRGNGDGEIQVYQNNVLTHTISDVITNPDDLVPKTLTSVNNYGEGRVSKTALGARTGLGYSDILIDNYGTFVYKP